jgi:hypothetical protein
MFSKTHNICGTHIMNFNVPIEKELLIVDGLIGELLTLPNPVCDNLIYEGIIVNMERRFRVREEKEVRHILKIDEEVEKVLKWTFEHIDHIEDETKLRLRNFIVFYMM